MIGYVSPTRQRTRILAPHLGAILAAWAIEDALRPYTLRGLGADALPADYNADVAAQNAALAAYIPRVQSAINSRGFHAQIEYVAGGTSSGSGGTWARSDQYVIRIAEFPAWIGALVASWITSYDPDERARYYIGEAQRWQGTSMYDNQYTSVSEPAPAATSSSTTRTASITTRSSPTTTQQTTTAQSSVQPVTNPAPRVVYYTEPYRPRLPAPTRTTERTIEEQIGAPSTGGPVEEEGGEIQPAVVVPFDWQAMLDQAKQYWWLAAILAAYLATKGGRRR